MCVYTCTHVYICACVDSRPKMNEDRMDLGEQAARYIQNLHLWPQLRGHLGVGAQLASVKSQPGAPDGPDTSLLVYNAVWALC